jgi:hypothetical protein
MLLLVLILFTCISSTSAMQTASSLGATLHSAGLPANILPPLLLPTITPSQMLLLGVTEQFGCRFRPPNM